jgi:dihydroflavonol-4-reductase
VKRVVVTSTISAIGPANGKPADESTEYPEAWLGLAYPDSKHEGERAAFEAADRAGVELVAVNPCSVQGPGRAGGTGKILIAYLNGRLKAFVDTNLCLVDIDDCIEGHVRAAQRGVPGERYVLAGANLTALEALDLVAELSGVREHVRLLPPAAARTAAALTELAFRARGRTPPVCRAMVRTLLHGHRYDGSRATRELGLEYRPVRETLRRTIAWAVAEGLVHRPLPGWEPASAGTTIS